MLSKTPEPASPKSRRWVTGVVTHGCCTRVGTSLACVHGQGRSCTYGRRETSGRLPSQGSMAQAPMHEVATSALVVAMHTALRRSIARQSRTTTNGSELVDRVTTIGRPPPKLEALCRLLWLPAALPVDSPLDEPLMLSCRPASLMIWRYRDDVVPCSDAKCSRQNCPRGCLDFIAFPRQVG